MIKSVLADDQALIGSEAADRAHSLDVAVRNHAPLAAGAIKIQKSTTGHGRTELFTLAPSPGLLRLAVGYVPVQACNCSPSRVSAGTTSATPLTRVNK